MKPYILNSTIMICVPLLLLLLSFFFYLPKYLNISLHSMLQYVSLGNQDLFLHNLKTIFTYNKINTFLGIVSTQFIVKCFQQSKNVFLQLGGSPSGI